MNLTTGMYECDNKVHQMWLEERVNKLEERVQELEARLEATSRVLFQLTSYNKHFILAVADHLFYQEFSRDELTDRANELEKRQRDKYSYYFKFAEAVTNELDKMKMEDLADEL